MVKIEDQNFCRMIVSRCDGKKLEVLGYSCFDIHYCFYHFLLVVGARSSEVISVLKFHAGK